MNNSRVDRYLQLPYTIEVVRDEEGGGWVAHVVELPGCITQGDTFEELGGMIQDAMRGWIEVALEDGLPIPEPRPVEEYSGKFVVRVPRSLHRELVEAAEREGVSLNAFISVTLGKSVSEISPRVVKTIAAEPLPVFNWPRLSEQARRVLIVNGFAAEVQEVDERLFANWIEDHLEQIRSAMEQGYYREALQYIRNIRQSLELLCEQSPLITTYCRVVSLLEEQIDQNFRLREGLIGLTYIKNRVSEQARITTQSFRPVFTGVPSNLSVGDVLEKLSQKDEEELTRKWMFKKEKLNE